MKLFPVLDGAAKAYLRTRDEHCPPHVHIGHKGQGWEAKIGFSYVSDQVTVMEVYSAQGRPTTATLNAVLAEVSANLLRCREKWPQVVPDLHLDNRWVMVAKDGKVKLLQEYKPGARQIHTAEYAPAQNQVTLVMKDGSRHQFEAGTGEVE